jgi:transcriptional regulator with XRE-family HTH domain
MAWRGGGVDVTQPAASRDWIGYRTARWRDLAGLSQRELAERVGVSREYISMIESGRRPVSTRRLLADLAHALGIRIEDLTAQPIAPRNPDEMVLYGLAPAIRRALDQEDPPPDTPRTRTQLAADVDRCLALRMAADWNTLADLLPALLSETAALESDEGRLLHIQALVAASLICQKTGYLDLARRCADLAAGKAGPVGESMHAALAAYAVGQSALAGGSPRHSLATSEQGVQVLQSSDFPDGDAVAIAGMLHLCSALSAGSLGLRDRATDHLREATELATQVIGDPWRFQFGPANVGVWRVGVACESADWGRAPELAAAVDTSQLRTPDRISRLHVDAGRGWYETGHAARATTEFLTAMEISARATRVLPCVREVTAQLARDAGPRGGSAELRRLVSWVGVDPLAE